MLLEVSQLIYKVYMVQESERIITEEIDCNYLQNFVHIDIVLIIACMRNRRLNDELVLREVNAIVIVNKLHVEIVYMRSSKKNIFSSILLLHVEIIKRKHKDIYRALR